MRVMLVAHHLPPDGMAGVERVAYSLGRELIRLGDTVSIVTRRIAYDGVPHPLRERLPDGALHYRFSGGVRPLEPFLLHHERLEEQFTSALVECDPDVVHVHHLLGLSPRFIQQAHRLEIPVVVSLHDFYFACPRITLRKTSGEICDGPDGGLECARTCYAGQGQEGVLRWGLRTQYFRTVLQLPERFISPSRHMAGFFSDFGLSGDRIRVIPNGVALDVVGRAPMVPPQSRPRGHLNIAYLGTVVEHKGAHTLIEALRLAKLPAANLVVAGHIAEDAYRQRLVNEAAAVPGLRLRVHGTYEIEELPGLLDDIDCLVIPSQWPETFAIVAREAFIRGVPAVVSRVGGLQEAINEGENGFSFAPDRPDELAGILRRLAVDDVLLSRLRKGALSTPVLSLADNAIAVREVYDEAIEESGGQPLASALKEQLRFLHATSVDAGFAAVGGGL